MPASGYPRTLLVPEQKHDPDLLPRNVHFGREDFPRNLYLELFLWSGSVFSASKGRNVWLSWA